MEKISHQIMIWSAVVNTVITVGAFFFFVINETVPSWVAGFFAVVAWAKSVVRIKIAINAKSCMHGKNMSSLFRSLKMQQV